MSGCLSDCTHQTGAVRHPIRHPDDPTGDEGGPDDEAGPVVGDTSLTTDQLVDPEGLMAWVRARSATELHLLAEAVRQAQLELAIGTGDHDAIIARAFETGFGRDGLGVLPWVEGDVIVCPGGLVSKSRTSHRCRFVSVDGVWVWDSGLLLREDKRSSPGVDEGFRAVALVPLVDGTGLDVVSGRARSGGHSVDHVVSYEVRRGELVEVSQRSITPSDMR